MSLILEALRKSEAERQIGRAPGLLTPMPMTTTPESGRRGWLVGALVLLVAVAIILAWWLGRNGQSAASTASEPAVTGELAPTAAPTAVTTPPDAVQSVPPAAAVDSAPPAAVRPLPAPGPADFPSDPDFESVERESLPVPAPASAAQPITAVPITSAPIAAEPTPAMPVPAPTEAAAPTAAPIAAAVPDGPPTTPLSALTEAERTGLPPLRLSMHVFNAEPSRRFVMIDGRRRAEGDALAADVKLAEIRREGAVVDIRGRLVLIERP